MKNNKETQSWTKFVEALGPLEQLAIIGLIDKDPSLTPANIDVANIVGEEKCYRASRWLNERFRELLYCYCDFCAKIAKPVGAESADTTSLIMALASLLMAAKGISMAPAVAFSAWALQSGLKLWCKQYGKIQLDGKGSYVIDPYANYFGDFPPSGTQQTLEGAYSITYFPAITQVVRDPKYTHPLHQIDIKEPARAEGHFIPSPWTSMETIAEYCNPKHEHRFSFSDTVSGRILEGTVSLEHLRACPSDLDLAFVAEEVTLK